MKILFLGLLYDREIEKMILSKSKCGLQGACNTFQWNLISGFDEILEKPIQIFNSLPVGTYPKYYKQLFIKTKAWSHIAGAEDKEIGYINLPGLKQLIRKQAFLREIKHWCRENPEEELYIITYSLYLPYLKVMSDLKRKYKNLCTCVIVPDLPNAFGFEKPGLSLKKSVMKYLGKLQYKYAKAADSHILLTKDMVDPLDLEGKPYVIVEGICDANRVHTDIQPADNSVIILYTGALHKRFGLDKLVNAFQRITQSNYQLWICGTGDYQEEIEKSAIIDSRIKYHGYVSKDEIIEMQQQATILINPRPNEEKYVKYSFPSKTIEYMASGKPVLMFKLDGIPMEYDDYLYYIKENTVDCIAQAILSICEQCKVDLDEKGKRAQDFVIKNKNGKMQAKKILEMLQEAMWNIKTPDNRVDFHVNDGDQRNFKLIMDYDEGKNKILQINITSQYGSTGRKVEEIHNYLVENRYLSYIAYSAFHSDLENSFKIENTFQNYLRRFLNRIFGRKYAHSALGTLRLIRKIKKIGPDLIHLHNIQQNSIHFPMFMKFLKEYGVPVVYTLHDCWAFTGGCYHFTELGCEGYKTGCRECKLDRKHRDISNRTPESIYDEKKTALHAIKDLQIICVSRWLKSCAEQSFMKDLRLQVIYNGIDTSLFKPVISKKREELGISNNEFMILGVANNWDERKGLKTFFRLSMILNPSYRIVLVGLSDESCPPNILRVPRTDSIQELVELYSSADVFFNASKEETFGLVTAEAMACGTPVIAYHSTACGEVVSKDTGILLNTFQMEDLLIAIENIRGNGKLKYQKQCVDHIHKQFSNEKMLYHYIKLYDQMIIKSEIV